MATTRTEPQRTRQTSTERGGVGQSGYTAGRTRDPALESMIQTRNTAYPRGDEDQNLRKELATDDRFTGRGGVEIHEAAEEEPKDEPEPEPVTEPEDRAVEGHAV